MSNLRFCVIGFLVLFKEKNVRNSFEAKLPKPMCFRERKIVALIDSLVFSW